MNSVYFQQPMIHISDQSQVNQYQWTMEVANIKHPMKVGLAFESSQAQPADVESPVILNAFSLVTENHRQVGLCDRLKMEPVVVLEDVMQMPLRTQDMKGKKAVRRACPVCGQVLVNLRNHILQVHTTIRPHVCSLCQKGFLNKAYLEIHIRTHTGERPFSCIVCGQRFTANWLMQYHLRRVHSVKDELHECHICGKNMSSAQSLLYHKRTHTGERPIACRVCNARFTRPSALNVHVRSHTGDYRHTCEICHKSFIDRSNLNSHRRTHFGEHPHICELCGTKFTRRSSLKKHIKGHTEPARTCTICSKEVHQDMKRHMRTHFKPHICDICGKGFSECSKLRRHQVNAHKTTGIAKA